MDANASERARLVFPGCSKRGVIIGGTRLLLRRGGNLLNASRILLGPILYSHISIVSQKKKHGILDLRLCYVDDILALKKIVAVTDLVIPYHKETIISCMDGPICCRFSKPVPFNHRDFTILTEQGIGK